MIARTPDTKIIVPRVTRRFDATHRASYCLEDTRSGPTESAYTTSQDVTFEKFSDKPKDFDFCAMQRGKGIEFEKLGLRLFRPHHENAGAPEVLESRRILRQPV